MAASPGGFSHFWKELRRRKVLRSLAIYAGTAFIILEASTIILPRWGLPDWSIDLVLYLLIFGALINMIIAWFYDIGTDGIQRTKPAEEISGQERIPDSRGWKIATFISLVVILGMVVYNIRGDFREVKAGDIQSLVILQRMDEALEQGRLALALDPKNPLVLSLYSTILKGAKQHDATLDYVEQALAIDPDHSFSLGQLERALYNAGEYEEAFKIQEAALVSMPGREKVPDLPSYFQETGRLATCRKVVQLYEESFIDREYYPLSMSIHYYRAGEFTKALNVLEIGYQHRNPNMPYIGTGSRYEALHDSARLLAILDNMNLPHPKKP